MRALCSFPAFWWFVADTYNLEMQLLCSNKKRQQTNKYKYIKYTIFRKMLQFIESFRPCSCQLRGSLNTGTLPKAEVSRVQISIESFISFYSRCILILLENRSNMDICGWNFLFFLFQRSLSNSENDRTLKKSCWLHLPSP